MPNCVKCVRAEMAGVRCDRPGIANASVCARLNAPRATNKIESEPAVTIRQLHLKLFIRAHMWSPILPFSLPTYSGSGRRIEMGAREKDDRNKGKKFFAIHSSLVPCFGGGLRRRILWIKSCFAHILIRFSVLFFPLLNLWCLWSARITRNAEWIAAARGRQTGYREDHLSRVLLSFEEQQVTQYVVVVVVV